MPPGQLSLIGAAPTYDRALAQCNSYVPRCEAENAKVESNNSCQSKLSVLENQAQILQPALNTMNTQDKAAVSVLINTISNDYIGLSAQ